MPKTGTRIKTRIVEAVAKTNGYTHRKKAFETVETMLELFKRSLETGEDVLISNFGKFCVKKKAKLKGRKPGDRRGPDAGAKKSGYNISRYMEPSARRFFSSIVLLNFELFLIIVI